MGTFVTFYNVHQLYSIFCTGLSLGFITIRKDVFENSVQYEYFYGSKGYKVIQISECFLLFYHLGYYDNYAWETFFALQTLCNKH